MGSGIVTRRALVALALVAATAACRPADPVAGGSSQGAPSAVRTPAPGTAPASSRAIGDDGGTPAVQRPAERPAAPRTVCERFARRVADFAAAHPADTAAFLAALRDEFVGGTDDPFALKEGLEQGRWNQAYFYAGHGGFRDEIDDAERYERGGNHQPGHFVSVLLIAYRFGEENARIAIAYAGDYEPGDEDDLRLSGYAIELGTGLAGGAVTPADVARRVAGFCR